ncbi:MAG: hypothetical protein ABIJ17_02910 [Patescibacteria group bacterium]
MKKVFLSLFLVSVMFFCLCCGFRVTEEYIVESATIDMLSVRTFVINDIETRMVAWKKRYEIATMSFDSNKVSKFWLLYPVEKITDDLEGKTIKMTYRITRLEKPPIVYVINIEIIN